MLAPRKKLWSTPSSAIDIAMSFADLDENDIVYDVGCGDGRVLIQLASTSLPLPPSPENNAEVDSAENTCDGDAIEEKPVVSSDAEKDGNNDDYYLQPQVEQIIAMTQSPSVSAEPTSDQNNDNSRSSQPSETQQQTQTIKPKQSHHCHRFIGIEISPERALEAQTNVKHARRSNLIPQHVSIEIRCMNALEVNYDSATVCFLYLVPRGLRLMKPLLWKKGYEKLRMEQMKGDEGGDNVEECGSSSSDDDDESEDGGGIDDLKASIGDDDRRSSDNLSIQMQTASVGENFQPPSSQETTTPPLEPVQHQLECTKIDATPSAKEDTTQQCKEQKKKPRRIITYMAGFENEQYIGKENCKVEHQEGAAWPVYLYHVDV